MYRYCLSFLLVLLFAANLSAQVPTAVNRPIPTILQYMVDAVPEHSFFLKAVRATQLEHVFEGADPITVFLPNSQSFPPGFEETMLQPEHADSLKTILTLHVLAGNWDLAALTEKIKENGGSLTLPTIGDGRKLDFRLTASGIEVGDGRGSFHSLNMPITRQNGVIYLVDRLFLP